jgi:hypothetical protein
MASGLKNGVAVKLRRCSKINGGNKRRFGYINGERTFSLV